MRTPGSFMSASSAEDGRQRHDGRRRKPSQPALKGPSNFEQDVCTIVGTIVGTVVALVAKEPSFEARVKETCWNTFDAQSQDSRD